MTGKQVALSLMCLAMPEEQSYKIKQTIPSRLVRKLPINTLTFDQRSNIGNGRARIGEFAFTLRMNRK